MLTTVGGNGIIVEHSREGGKKGHKTTENELKMNAETVHKNLEKVEKSA